MLLSVTSLLMSRGEMKMKASLSLAATSSSSSTRGIPPICVDTPSNSSERWRIYNLIDNLGIPQRCKKQIKTILCCSRNNNRPLTIFRSYKICNLSKPQKLKKIHHHQRQYYSTFSIIVAGSWDWPMSGVRTIFILIFWDMRENCLHDKFGSLVPDHEQHFDMTLDCFVSSHFAGKSFV